MFADPQSVTVSGDAKSLARVGTTNPATKGSFTTADGIYAFDVSQNKSTNRFRREVRLTKSAVAADPISAVNKEVSASVIIVIDEPRFGFSDADLTAMLTGLVTWASASTYAKVGQLLTGEL
jgi:hypothetical protein